MKHLFAIGFENNDIIGIYPNTNGDLVIVTKIYESVPLTFAKYEDAAKTLQDIQEYDKDKVIIQYENVVDQILAEKDGSMYKVEDLNKLKIYVFTLSGTIDENNRTFSPI